MGQSDSSYKSTCDSTRSHQVLESVTRCRPTILQSLTAVCHWFHGPVQLDWRLASNLQLHTENPKHSIKHNIKINHSYCHTHPTIPKLPKAYYYTYTTKKLQKWLSNSEKKMRGGEQEKVIVICKEKGMSCVLFQREVWQRNSHLHEEWVWFLAFDFKENHQEESEMMFDKNGRQEEISLHYKNKERKP